jgi:bacterial/archaeal transporter family-2 protein
MKPIAFLILGILAGTLITIQSVLNADLGKRTGQFGSVFLLTLVSIAFLAVLMLLIPGTANLKALPGPKEWYLYAGGVLGVGILAAPILLIPRIGATSTLTALVVGQLLMALLVDHFGLLSSPRIEVNLPRIAGAVLLVAGAFLIARK